ncbi:hypothetical protein KSL82_08915 [Limosilactobacillus portuensis]|uniref:Uncharacterized protein n=1 Tax=Limosilactobacillus portuensis TaxID=2742601 RepID=A0ABS6IYD9_9LACO|nr:hypothetical protein [Limosilactobacillus portuensis]MBU9696001.1 hypothetical protein [Limosilactobacillus portuensis]
MAEKDNVYIKGKILVDCKDTETNVPGKGCSYDNGATWTVIATPDGLMFHQKDTDKLSKLKFEKLQFKSPNGTAFYLSVSDDGKPVFTPVEKGDESS